MEQVTQLIESMRKGGGGSTVLQLWILQPPNSLQIVVHDHIFTARKSAAGFHIAKLNLETPRVEDEFFDQGRAE